MHRYAAAVTKTLSYQSLPIALRELFEHKTMGTSAAQANFLSSLVESWNYLLKSNRVAIAPQVLDALPHRGLNVTTVDR